MDKFDYDLFVIGAGSGGVRAARMASSFGARVAITEDRYLGGTCVNVGCVPKKLLVYASHFAEDFENSRGFGWKVGSTDFNWQQLIKNKNTEIERLNGVYEKILSGAGVELIEGHGSLVDEHTVAVDGKNYSAERILIATGGWPSIPDIPGKEHVISSNEVFFLEKLPEKVIIAGGGYIAVEFAGIFNGLGVDTTLLYRGPLFLRGFDEDVRKFLAEEMRKKGINLKFETIIDSIEKTDNQLQATLTDGSTLTADQILYATGRKPKTEGIGIESLGIKLDKAAAIVVNDEYQTNIPSIYAVGDVTNRVNLTPVALAEGMFLARRLYNNETSPVDYENIPTCVFSQPNIGTVGLTEEEARDKYDQIDIYKSSFMPMKHTLSGADEKTFMKLIVDKATDRVIGVHMVGPDAGEIMQGIGIAMKAGASKSDFDKTIGIHPTTAEEFVTMREPVD
ncbi:MAG: glutathione-disulfide reductase [Gammaproteobacteria bacterium]|nr:MAG: glutathione-disulfide reductase [Gammaproteobacteria bacterium]RKZ71545.1 MAG: glutathione-disulfide reductase [Gammaproteobacteria bacterium]